MPYSPGGYSWLGMAPEPHNVPMRDREKMILDKDIEQMKKTAITLEEKISFYHSLCKEYEKEAGTPKGEKIFHQLEALKKEIKQLSKKISHTLEESSEITHLRD